jgi:peptide/nickel transport system substrate-binding protein
MMTEKIKHYQNQFRKGILPRRDFIKLATAAGISTTALGSLLTIPAFAETPKRGGRLTVGVEARKNVESLDPTNYQGTGDILRGFAMYDTLVNRGLDLLPTPYLAESWESNANASKWVFKLRRGVEFHNGKNFTADDVIYSFRRHIHEKSESPGKAYLSQIKVMKKLDRHTVEFTLFSPNADWPIILSDTRTHITQDGYEDFKTTTVGTGPFKVKEFKPGFTCILERNPNYWGSGGPYVDEIEYVGAEDSTSRVNALLSGDLDLILYLDPKTAPLIERRKDMSLIQAKSSLYTNLVMMRDRSPSNNNDVRLAMKYALDREMVLKNVYKGFGHIGNDHPISPVDPYYNHDIPQRAYDPDKARYHIKKAGLENSSIDLYACEVTGAGSTAACEVFQESARKTGVNLNLIKPPADTYWSNVWRKKPFHLSQWDPRPVPDLMFSIAYKSGADANESVWNNAKFDKLLVEARSVTNFKKRKEMYGEMQRMLQDDGGVSILAFLDFLDATHKSVKGIKPHPSGPLGFYQFATNVWLDS